MKYERAVAKSKWQDLLCSRILGHIGLDVGNNQIFLFSLLEYGSEERPKNEDVEARKLGASNLLPFAVQTTNHYPTARRSLEGGALAGITILPRFRVCMLRRRENND